jgi:hypothetical protein
MLNGNGKMVNGSGGMESGGAGGSCFNARRLRTTGITRSDRVVSFLRCGLADLRCCGAKEEELHGIWYYRWYYVFLPKSLVVMRTNLELKIWRELRIDAAHIESHLESQGDGGHRGDPSHVLVLTIVFRLSNLV